jgi:GntR family transcriptional regulator
MPLDLDPTSINQFSGVPLHRQLADHVRDAITSGRLRPGEALPSEADLAAALGMSRNTVRAGINQLVTEGRIVKRSGLPTRVAIPPPVRHMATSRYQDWLNKLRRAHETGEPLPRASAFTDDHGVSFDEHSIQAAYSEAPAAGNDATRLEIAIGTPVLRRKLIKIVHGAPVQIQNSVIPLELVTGTPVADPERQPWPGGTIAELYSVGLEVTHVSERARARPPKDEERRLLQMETAGVVFEIVRVFSVGHGEERRPVEASVVVCPAANMELAYETDLT